MNQAPHVAIVGATGAVGVEILSCLETRNFPVGSLKLLASARSAGKQVAFRGKMLTVEELTEKSFDGVDIALFSAGGGISLKFAPIAAAAGCVVIDNSSAFRQEPDVPLVVPEINPEAAFNHPRNIIANPNCTTIITLMALFPLHQRFGLKTVIASSYQAVSGSGQHGIAELETQVRAVVDGHPVVKNVYPHQIAFNLLPQIDSFTAQFEKPVDLETARSAYEGKPGVALMDNPAEGVWPTPLDSTNGDTCYVGRMRMDMAIDNALTLWVVGDQVRKGAALNAVQIAELLVNR